MGTGLASLTSPVATANGLAVSTYTALGCSGADIITATATVGGVVLTATATVNVLPATVGSLQFVSATPINITLRGVGGAGLSETSTVVFLVRDITGVAVVGQQVSFTLDTQVGGITLSQSTDTSLADGTVRTIVRSGTQQTPVRVTATIVGVSPTISTQSDQLSISSGLPDQNSFSISAVTLNPEAFDIDGVVVPITIAVSDQFNTPVPDQTAVTFTTEGARIAPASCLTISGSCTVDWISSDPRPLDGRVTIRATAIGEESFVDSNGNARLDTNAEPFLDVNRSGFFELGELFTDRDGNGVLNPEHFADISEAFTDNNEDLIRNPTEPFLDFNGNGLFDGPDGKYNGILCTDQAEAPGAICDAPRTLTISADIVLVMADSDASIAASSNTIALAQCSNFAPFTPSEATINVVAAGSDNGQTLPAGTTIVFSSNNGTVTSPSPTTITVSNTTLPPEIIPVTVRSDATQVMNPQPLMPGQTPFTCTNPVMSGVLTIRVTSPGGTITTATIAVTD